MNIIQVIFDVLFELVTLTINGFNKLPQVCADYPRFEMDNIICKAACR